MSLYDDEREELVGGGAKAAERPGPPRWFYAGVLLLGAAGLYLLAGDGSPPAPAARPPAGSRGPQMDSAVAQGDAAPPTAAVPPAGPAPPPAMSPDAASAAGSAAVRGAAREVSVPACGDGQALVDDFRVSDGSGPAAAPTAVRLCWTPEHLQVTSTAADAEVTSTHRDCGSRTWEGDSLEVFMSPGLSTPTAWMEVNVAAAGGMWFSAVSGVGRDTGPDTGRQGYPYESTSAEPVGAAGVGPCRIPGVEYAAEQTTEGWADSLTIPWSAFSGLAQFSERMSASAEFPPREWRINFYRMDFSSSGQRDPDDFYAWSPTTPPGAAPAFHRPENFGVMRLLEASGAARAAAPCVQATEKPPALTAAQQTSSGPAQGWLMVTGGGGLPRSSADRFLLKAQQSRGGTGGADATIVYIPTNDGRDYSSEESRADAVSRLESATGWHGRVTLLHTTDRAEADTEAFSAPIAAAGGVWFGGGRQWRMADAYGGTATEAALHRVLERDGILGGSSAGASIQGDFLVRGDTASNEPVIGDHTIGFGFVRGVGFDQHTMRRNRQNDMVEVVEQDPSILGLSLDEQTSVLIRGDELEVLGSVVRGVYSYVAVTDATLWSDTKWCGNYAMTSGVGRPLLANHQKFFLLHTGMRYNLRTREVLASVTPQTAVCDIVATTQSVPGSGLSTGTMYLTYTPGAGTDVEIEAHGMTPGLHGVHIHASGDLSDMVSGTSLGGHYNPHESPHGCAPAPRKVGDLGNLIVDEDGHGYYAERNNMQLELDGPFSVVGRGLVVHALEDNCVAVEGAAGDLSAGARVGICRIVADGEQGTVTRDGYTTSTWASDSEARDARRSYIRKRYAAATCSGTPLCEPSSPGMTMRAPVMFDISFETTRGTFIVRVPRDWSPRGADRLFNLVQNNFFTDARFYRVIAGFVAQFGSSGNPSVDAALTLPDALIPNDAPNPDASNVRGTIAFGAEYDANEMAVNRSTEMYINLVDNVRLDSHGFTPVGWIVSGMDHVAANIYDGYGEMQDICWLHNARPCDGPLAADLYERGNEYLDAEFPRMDRILSARVVDLPPDMATEVTAQNVMGHLRHLQAIGTANGGNRDIGGPGFNASRDYVLEQLRQNTNFDVSVQYFPFVLARVIGTPSVAVADDGAWWTSVPPTGARYRTDFREMSNGAFSGEVSGVAAVAGTGCSASDFAGFAPGSIALIMRGGCSFFEKGANAQRFGAAGSVIVNNVGGVLHGTLGDTGSEVGIPVMGMTQSAGEQLISVAGEQTFTLAMSVFVDVRTVICSNIIAETRQGDDSNVVVVGSHLDSVAAGPGINDNGSGTATNLEMALSLARLLARGAVSLTNQVRFCWWGAEEEGLVGSHWYVDHLSDEEISRVALNLNYDMIASPNYIIGVYNGSSLLPGGGAEELRTGGLNQARGSAALQTMFEDRLTSIGSPSVPIHFNGRSDYGPFLARGIPAGGLETGAEKGKTMEERAMFGGTAQSAAFDAAYDPCYHQSCDTIDNINIHALEVNAPTAAWAVQFLGTHPHLRTFLHSDEEALTLDTEVTVENVMKHLRTLQTIADDNGGNRDIAEDGFSETANYIESTLREHTDFTVEVQPFPYRLERIVGSPLLEMTAPTAATFSYRGSGGRQFRPLSYSVGGDVTAQLWGPPDGQARTHPPHHGCSPTDFIGFPAGAIALLERGDTESMLAAGLECTFAEAAANAHEAGAAGVILFDANSPNHDSIPRSLRSLGQQALELGVTIPVFAVNFDVVLELRQALTAAPTGVRVHMMVSKTVSELTVSNIIATTRQGDPDNKVVVGSHMDGVRAGPGINDNGSGTATNLEMALSLARLLERGALALTNQVRFCWWGAEEEGLVGSRWYVDHLSDEEISRVALNLNYDMIASPNYIIGTYNGAQLAGTDAPMTQQTGSLAIMEMYNGYLDDMGSPHVPVEFNGRSDYGPFLARGVPCGGLETGAEKIKSEEERRMFGGWANAAYDTCYHQRCDTIDNVNPRAIAFNAPTAAFAVEFLATHAAIQSFLGFASARAELEVSGGGRLIGTVTITQSSVSEVEIAYEIRGLAPGSVHGFHVHEFAAPGGDCAAAAAHYNPFGRNHGAPRDPPEDRQVGSNGNVVADERGVASGVLTESLVRLFGETSVVGRSVVLHEGEDDLGRGGQPCSLTTGCAGGRLACGTIVGV